MELIATTVASVVAFMAALAAHFVAHDAYAYATRYSRRLIEWAAAALPENEQNRYREEWLAHLDELPSIFLKFRHAVECSICAKKVASIHDKALVSASNALQEDLQIKLDRATAIFLLAGLKMAQNRRGMQAEQSKQFKQLYIEIERDVGPINKESVKTVVVQMHKMLRGHSAAAGLTVSCNNKSDFDKALAELGWPLRDK